MEMNRKGQFDYEITGGPDFGFLTVKIPAGRTLKVEASSMATMDTNVSMKTKLKGGLGRFLTGESLFLNEFKAEGGAGQIGIAPGPLGEIRHLYLENQTIYLQSSAFVAADPALKIETKWQGFVKGFFSGESLFLIKISGTGDIWFNSFGAILEIDVTDEYIVDTSYIVGFTEGVDYKVRPLAGLKTFFFSGEGLVCQFKGSGKVWVQTRQIPAFIGWIHRFRPVSGS